MIGNRVTTSSSAPRPVSEAAQGVKPAHGPSIQAVLVPAMLGRPEPAAIQAALAIADGSAARIEVMVGLSAVSTLDASRDSVPPGPFATLNASALAAAEVIAAESRRTLGDQRHTARVARECWLAPPERVFAGAAVTDLVILGRPGAPAPGYLRLFAAALLGTGRPLLLVPDGAALSPVRILIAWRACAEATRAVHDAVPLLLRAHTVRVVRALSLDEDIEGIDANDDALLRHLTRHGLKADFEWLPDRDASAGNRILASAQAMHADLIVAGGYGRARAMENLFGGVTRTLLRKAPMPVLFSH